MGYIDKLARWVIPAQYENGWYFSDSVAAVEKGGKFGYIDRSNRPVIPFRFDQTAPFHSVLAKVALDGSVGYIDRKGTVVWSALTR